MMNAILLRTALLTLAAGSLLFAQTSPASQEDWETIFNGKNLDGWVVKLAHHDLGDNFADTFRVEDGVLRVSYDKYPEFNTRFGHLFYRKKLSHFRLRMDYRFYGEQVKGGPSYAKLNSGVMFHSQAPETILKEQNWPISVEAQYLAGGRTTMNVCTPGTEIYRNGEMVKAHCTNSTSKIYTNDEWVSVEIEVLGGGRVRHIAGGQVVLEYERSSIGGGVAMGFDPAIKKDGMLLTEGYIGLQSESQPVEFRKVELLNLSGCMNPKATNYKSYYVNRDDSTCELPPVAIWPGVAPGSAGKTGEESVRLSNGERVVANVHRPTITPYLPEKDQATGAGVLVVPGGGHRELWTDHEGHNIAKWLAGHGVAAFVLKHRLAREKDSTYTIEGESLADTQQALRLIKSHAAEWNVKADRVGVMGFSAGGELAALAAARYAGSDSEVLKPAFQALIYPAIPKEMNLSKDTPPAFLVCGENDRQNISQGLPELYLAMKKAGVSAELHVYAGVGHGFGMRPTSRGAVAGWPERFLSWLGTRKLLGP